MRLDTKRPGTSTTFLDATSGEAILQLACDAEGLLFVAYHLYDASGAFVAESAGLVRLLPGLAIRCAKGEMLLDVPADCNRSVCYCLYNSDGRLLTISDGVRTKIYPLLQMTGVARLWSPPTAN